MRVRHRNKENNQTQTQGKVNENTVDKDLQKNVDAIKSHFDDIYDLIIRSFKIGGHTNAKVIYIENFTKIEELDKEVLKPLMEATDLKKADAQTIIDEKMPVVSAQLIPSLSECIRVIYSGHAVLMIEGTQQAIKIGLSQEIKRAVKEPENEPVIRGPKVGFNESIGTNKTLLRQVLQTPRLKMKSLQVGTFTHTEVVVAYIETIADKTLVEEVINRIKRIKIDGVLESGYVEEMIEDHPHSPFPQVKNTERLDSVSSNLLEGRVAILVDGTPTVLIVPISLTSLIQAADDYFNRSLFGTSFRLLRIFSLFVALITPAFYVAIMMFHQEMVPTALLISIASAREAIPFPTIVEAILMQLTFEVLREAGLRLPRQVGSAVTIVGALVVGEAAVDAGFVSASMVIVIAITGITSFTAPHYSLETAIRILRIVLILLAGFLGMLGLVFGLIAIAIHLCTLRSFGLPYLSPLAPAQHGEGKDTWIRAPWWKMNKRPRLTGDWNSRRQSPDQKPGPWEGNEN